MKTKHKTIRRSHIEIDRAIKLAEAKYEGNQSAMYKDLVNREYFLVFPEST